MNRFFSVLALLIGSGASSLFAQQEFLLNNFNNAGFTTLTGGFQQEIGQFAARVFDTADGFGSASQSLALAGGTVNLSPFANGGTLNVRYNPLAGHGTDYFTVDLFDSLNRSLSYRVDTTLPTQGGQFGFYEPEISLASPFSGSLANFDFSRVSRWGITGQPTAPGPFNVSLFNVELEAAPAPVTYGGRSLASPWRAEAAERIERIRKSDLELGVVDSAGNPIVGATVRVEQTRQAFQFGTAVAVNQLLGTSNNDRIYRERLLELFNTVTIENELKWDALAGQFGPQLGDLNRTLSAMRWLQDNGLQTRGHVLVWPGSQNSPDYLDPLIGAARAGDANARAQLRSEIDRHITDTARATDGLVVDWDVVNEIGTNNDILNIFGEAEMDRWFQLARQSDADAKLFINEFNILSDDERAKRGRYLSSIQGLVNRGAEIDGIGFQGHFRPNSLTDFDRTGGTDPQTIWEVFDQFHDSTGLPITITEYDLETTDEQLKADYLRDLVTAAFAHEGVDGFVMWGFWEGRHWRPDAAIFNQNWTETPSVQVWRDLVLDAWLTDESLLSDGDGVALRAFHGDYTVTVEYGDQTYTFDLSLGADGLARQLVLPISVVPEPSGAALLTLAGFSIARRRTRNRRSLPASGVGDAFVAG